MKYQVVKIPTQTKEAQCQAVLIIYTGGTMGMTYDDAGVLVPFDFEGILKEMPSLKAMNLELTVVSFERPIDSSNVTLEHWNLIASIIQENYQDYCGFVVLHGTDTLAYSASALSFMLEGLDKPVIFTGSQLPMGAVRSDASQNLVASLQIVSSTEGLDLIKEVCVYFDYFLYRGNRCKKVESSHFDAFESENYPPLAEVGINIEYNPSAFQSFSPVSGLKIQEIQNVGIALVKLYPGMTAAYFHHVLRTPGLQAVVLETFGSGNAPTDDWFIESIKQSIAQGIVFFNVSQCNGGRVMQGRYATSAHLLEAGVISGHDITTEAALSKVLYLFSKYPEIAQIRTKLGVAMRGEMTH